MIAYMNHPEQSIGYWDLCAYLSITGWRLVDDPSAQFVVFEGPKDVNNQPLEIVFLRNPSAQDQQLFIANALEILCSLENAEPYQIILKINGINRDNLKIRLIDSRDDNNTIPLRLAASQINEIKQLVAYGTRSEIDQKPFYLDAQHIEAKRMVENYRFGHTFKGSFGFTIQTPPLLDLHKYTQLSLLPEFVSSKSNVPVWRRVMERIARGLNTVQRATRERDARIIIQDYKQGLNANMCQALADMLVEKRLSLEYQVIWAATKLPDDPELINAEPVLLNEQAFHHLEYASNALFELQPEEVTIKGTIVELSAKDSPLALDTSRTIRIRWQESTEGKVYEATATLDRDDYQRAIEAHKTWNSIVLTGYLLKQKRNWTFVSYSVFEVVV